MLRFPTLSALVFAVLLASLALLVVPPAPCLAGGGTLTVYYFERPPYYYTHDGHPAGFLVLRAREMFEAAGVPARFESTPSKRILHRLRAGEPCCSVGWFRTPGREEFAWFTEPIHRDKELVALFGRGVASAVYGHADVASLVSDRSLVLGVVDGFSYGRVVDELLRRLAPPVERVTATQRRMVAMMCQGRFDYMFVAPEEADVLLSEASPRLGALLLHLLAGVPEGNTRHIVCSKSVPAEVRRRLDRAIRALHPDAR
ncbi:substrate-binding periplasmic protein [Desulfocurvus sp. DL9XJH121]